MYKVVLLGSFQFGNEIAYKKMADRLLSRMETYYKNDALIKDTHLNPELFSIAYSKLKSENLSEKTARNTEEILNELASYAVCGQFHMTVIPPKELGETKFIKIKPSSFDKSAVANFDQAVKMRRAGKLDDAAVLLSKIIEKYPTHFSALMLRGKVLVSQKDFEGALQDFDRSLDLDPALAQAYLGRVVAKKHLGKDEDILTDINAALSNTIPVQYTFWKAKRMKGNRLFEMGQYAEALAEYNLFLNHKFDSNNPHKRHLNEVLAQKGLCLYFLEKKTECITAFETLLKQNPSASLEAIAVERLVEYGVLKPLSKKVNISQLVTA